MTPLTVDGLTARALVERFGSPLYVHEARVVRAQVERVRRAFGTRVRVAFAVKANPLVALARLCREAGLGAEVASAGELRIAEAASFPPDALLMAGPGKSDDDLRAALGAGARIHLESEREYERLRALASTAGVRPRVGIRVQPGESPRGAGLRMSDRTSRFGVDAARVPELARRIRAHGACDLTGFHCHAGSQVFDADAWLASAKTLLTVAAESESATGSAPLALDFGGGFGWPAHAGEEPFDVDRAGQGLSALLADAGCADREIWVEPGRFLVAPAGVYLTRAIDVKDSGGNRHVVLDGGMHHFGAAAGFGAPVRRAVRILHADDPQAAGPLEPVTLGGPLCTPADRFGKCLRLPRITPGDVLALPDAGAYGLTFSPLAFLSRPTPAEVLVDGGEAHLVREPGKPADALRGQRW